MPYDPKTVFDHQRKLPKAMRGYASLFQRSSNHQVARNRYMVERPLYGPKSTEVKPHPFLNGAEPCTDARASRFRHQKMRRDKPGKMRLNCKQRGAATETEMIGLWRKGPDGVTRFDPN